MHVWVWVADGTDSENKRKYEPKKQEDKRDARRKTEHNEWDGYTIDACMRSFVCRDNETR
jgi:hypothetical protein